MLVRYFTWCKLLKNKVALRYSSTLPCVYKTVCDEKDRKQDDKYKKPCPKDGSGRGFYLTLGAIILGTGAVVTYAKKDPEFRSWLKDSVPYSDEFITLVTFEKDHYISDQLWTLFQKYCKDDTCVEPALPPCPSPKFEPIEEEPKVLDVCKECEIERNAPQYMPGCENCVKMKRKEPLVTKEQCDECLKEHQKQNENEIMMKILMELEIAMAQITAEGIKAYEAASALLKMDVIAIQKLVEESTDRFDDKNFIVIKDICKVLAKHIETAERRCNSASEVLKKILDYIKNLPMDKEILNNYKKNAEESYNSVVEAKKKFDSEMEEFLTVDAYWNKVFKRRFNYSNELETMFPTIKIADKELVIYPDEFDLYLMQAYKYMLHYQREISRLDEAFQTRMDKVVRRKKFDQEEIDNCVEVKIDEQKDNFDIALWAKFYPLQAEFQKTLKKKMAEYKKKSEERIKEEIERMERSKGQEIQSQNSQELNMIKRKYKSQAKALEQRVKTVESTLKTKAIQDSKAQNAPILWEACHSLERTLKAPSNDEIKVPIPLQKEINAIAKAGVAGDEMVPAVISSLPCEISCRGVYTEGDLRLWFENVEVLAHRVALLGEGYSALPFFLVSYFVSLFVCRTSEKIPKAEVNNELFNPKRLSNYDILKRARYWMKRGDLANCLRYMNLLKGESRVVAQEWMQEARLFLELDLALRLLMSHAAVNGSVYS